MYEQVSCYPIEMYRGAGTHNAKLLLNPASPSALTGLYIASLSLCITLLVKHTLTLYKVQHNQLPAII